MHLDTFQENLEVLPRSQAVPNTLGKTFWNLETAELVEHALAKGESCLTDTGTLMVETGEFTGSYYSKL